jgi:hypothetical protein
MTDRPHQLIIEIAHQLARCKCGAWRSESDQYGTIMDSFAGHLRDVRS